VSYELITLLVAVLGTFIAWAALVMAGKVRDAASEANAIARRQATETERLNKPRIVVTCLTEDSDEPSVALFGSVKETYACITVTLVLRNAGNHSTDIVEGDVTLHSHKGPEHDVPIPLTGVHIAGGVEYRVPVIHKAIPAQFRRPGVTQAKISCKASYTSIESSNGTVDECYTYDPRINRFVVDTKPGK
jgi:hypothetical protein